VEPPQPAKEPATAHNRSSIAIARKAVASLRRLPSASASKLGNPSAAAQMVMRELPKGEEGNERLATTPVLIVTVEVGVDIRTLQQLLGHKTLTMVIRYTHLTQSHELAAVEKLCLPVGVTSIAIST